MANKLRLDYCAVLNGTFEITNGLSYTTVPNFHYWQIYTNIAKINNDICVPRLYLCGVKNVNIIA